MMRNVALVKWRNGQPIEDLRREVQVVEKAKNVAAREGLINVTATSRAQIRIAKLIQTRWHERWAREGLDGSEVLISLNALRERLDALDGEILSALNKALPSLRDVTLQRRLETIFLRRFTTGDLRNEERLSLFRALLQVRWRRTRVLAH
jgi:chorismate mutase-like protein